MDNNQISEKVESCVKYLETYLDFDAYVKRSQEKGEVRINNVYYRIQHLIECKNLVASNDHILALPKIDELFKDIIEHTKIDMLSNDAENQMANLLAFSKYYKENAKSTLDEVLSQVNLEELAQTADYAKIMANHKRWFNVSTYLNISTFKKPENISYSSKIYISNNPSQWLQSCVNKATEIDNFTDCFVSTFIKEDPVDRHFSYFIFALIMNGSIYLIDDRIKFGSINKKFFTRRPERSKEEFFDNIYLPYDLLFGEYEKFEVSDTAGTDVILYKTKEDSTDKLDVINFSSLDDKHKRFISYLVNYYIENGEEILNQAKAVSMHVDHNQLLLESGAQVKTSAYALTDEVLYWIGDILKQTGANEDSDDITNAVTTLSSTALQKSKYYDQYNLCTKEENDDLIRWISRRQASNEIYEKVENYVKQDRRHDTSDKKFFQDLYDQDRLKVLKKVFGSKEIFVNRDHIKYISYFNKEREDKTYILKQKQRLVYSYAQARDRLQYVFSDIFLAATEDYGYKKSECECHHCQLTNQTKKFPASVHAFVLCAHWKEVMWLFDLKDRNDLPRTMQLFQGDSNYSVNVGNTILNDIDPLNNVLYLRSTYQNTDHRRKSYININFALCARCAKWLQKSTTTDDEIIVDLDYQLLPESLASSDFNDFKIESEEYNKIFQEKYKHTHSSIRPEWYVDTSKSE